MTSKQTKQERLNQSRLKRAKKLAGVNTKDKNIVPPAGAISADHSQLQHNNTYGSFPLFYVDKVVVCRECGKQEVWTAESQKWWYEEVKANINTEAVCCRACRNKEKSRKEVARKIHLEGIAKKNET